MMIMFLCSCSNETLYEKAIDNVVEIICDGDINKSYGTGTIISNDGLILTNRHAIESFDMKDIFIKFNNDENMYNISIINKSDLYDLALIKVQIKTKCFKSFSTNVNVSDDVYSIGNSYGFGLSYYEGIISSEYKNIINDNKSILALQTNIEIYDGASGGPLFNKKCELLGIMTFRINDRGNYVNGMSFAIPSKIILEYLEGIELWKNYLLDYCYF